MKILLIFISLLTTCLYVQGQVYSYQDTNGNTIYTDKPPEGQKARLLDIDLTSPERAPSSTNSTATLKPPATAEPTYTLLRITLPEPGATLINTGGQIIVSVTSEPDLAPTHRYRILIDDNTVAESNETPVFSINNVSRGEHSLVAEIVNDQDAIIERTAAQPFYVRQTTLADKKRVNPCKYKDYGVRPECPLKDRPQRPRLLQKITNSLGITSEQ